MVLALDGGRISSSDLDAHFSLGISHLSFLQEGRALLADDAFLVQLGDAHGPLALGGFCAQVADLFPLGDLDRLFLVGLGHSDGFDISGFASDVLDVDVDPHLADLGELGLEAGEDAREEDIPVPIDLVDLHRCDHLAKVARNDVFGLLHDLRPA